jgi:hypothetical protein
MIITSREFKTKLLSMLDKIFSKLELSEIDTDIKNILMYHYTNILLISYIDKVHKDINNPVTIYKIQNICFYILLSISLNKEFIFNTDTLKLKHSITNMDIEKVNNFIKTNINKFKKYEN